MIKLTLIDKPVELTDEVCKQLKTNIKTIRMTFETKILYKNQYKEMKALVSRKGLWDEELTEIESTLKSIALFNNVGSK